MPRKAFIADIDAAANAGIPGMTGICRGEDDGDVSVCYATNTGLSVEISLLVTPDVGSYPSESSFMIFTKTEVIPDGVQQIIEAAAESSAGQTIPTLLMSVSTQLQNLFATGYSAAPEGVDTNQQITGDESESDEPDWMSDGDYELDDFDGTRSAPILTRVTLDEVAAVTLNRRIKEDLRVVRSAGFKFGILSGMRAESVNCLLSISIQVRKLGLSDEAIQAWDLKPQQYVTLLIRYTRGYKDFETVMNDPAKSNDIEFRIGTCKRYKPSLVEALAAFRDISKTTDNITEPARHDRAKTSADFSSLFISGPLNEFINTQFISILKIRHASGLGWDGAQRFFNDNQGKLDRESVADPTDYHTEPELTQYTLPDLVTADQLTEVTQRSFPLIAIQFAMRYLTQCTEFCLVCHGRIKEDFGALKPYVCDNPLCLYQYMSLGFGPSIEHEILSQPYVVDLLVSFCYASVMHQRIRDYPVGMCLSVPEILRDNVVTSKQSYGHLSGFALNRGWGATQTASDLISRGVMTPHGKTSVKSVKFDVGRSEIIFQDEQSCPVHVGDWVVVTSFATHHFRVEETTYFPTIKLSSTAVTQNSINAAATKDTVQAPTISSVLTPSTTPPPQLIAAKLLIYNQNFDDMHDVLKAEAMAMLIETLPSVREMQQYLLQQSTSEPSLRTWKDRISPAALGILRWIVASNRSCIVQVDNCPGQDGTSIMTSKVRTDQRVSNISESWLQFRFAQGSPDKEQRFMDALRNQQLNFDARYPTLFAFHGSPLQNWHGIIRTGLNFDDTMHGRAFGHGVYHAQDQNVSLSYAVSNSVFWQASELKITSAMSLNEIVNCPQQFVSSNPHLVVQHIDWIQCRYLMVQVQDGGSTQTHLINSQTPSAQLDPELTVEQDPHRTAKSTLRKEIGVPLCATSTSRRFCAKQSPELPVIKKRKYTVTLENDPTICSDSEDVDDLTFILSDEEVDSKNGKRMEVPRLKSETETSMVHPTDFVQGSLDQSTLPILALPEYATSTGTKTLNRNLKEVIQIQEKTPPHELGWYIDVSLISNIYQWIVELHTFDASLPLAKDMKAAAVTSIVLEIRFGKDYPFSPPFVRVIRPRFLPFTQGGGGHVTAGGAMCMELLTNSGWSSVSSIEGILLQVRLALCNLEPRPARLEGGGKQKKFQDYGTGEAVAAYIRACEAHGWEVPRDFREFADPSGLKGY